jgi:hypothetical protein
LGDHGNQPIRILEQPGANTLLHGEGLRTATVQIHCIDGADKPIHSTKVKMENGMKSGILIAICHANYSVCVVPCQLQNQRSVTRIERKVEIPSKVYIKKMNMIINKLD